MTQDVGPCRPIHWLTASLLCSPTYVDHGNHGYVDHGSTSPTYHQREHLQDGLWMHPPESTAKMACHPVVQMHTTPCGCMLTVHLHVDVHVVPCIRYVPYVWYVGTWYHVPCIPTYVPTYVGTDAVVHNTTTSCSTSCDGMS